MPTVSLSVALLVTSRTYHATYILLYDSVLVYTTLILPSQYKHHIYVSDFYIFYNCVVSIHILSYYVIHPFNTNIIICP